MRVSADHDHRLRSSLGALLGIRSLADSSQFRSTGPRIY
jgi:hypothetical protein